MERVKQYFREHEWPWWGLAGVRSPGSASVVPIIQTMSRHQLYAAFGHWTKDRFVLSLRAHWAIDYTPEPVEEEVVSRDEVDERRADAEGRTGELTVSLAWNTTDDLDLAVREPGGTIIYHKNRRSASGGELDVDRNFGTIENGPTRCVGKLLLGESTPLSFRSMSGVPPRGEDRLVQCKSGKERCRGGYSLNGENQDAVTVNFSYRNCHV